MKSVFAVCSMLLLLTACNQPVKVEENAAAKDSLPVTIPAADSVVTEVDYTKRTISIPASDWQSMQTNNRLVLPKNSRDMVSGDFNGDGKKETATLAAPTEDTTDKENFQQCFGGCNSYLFISGGNLPLLVVHDNLGGEIKNAGDLDGDGADEIIVYPSWWQSNWNPYRIYSFSKKDNQWHYLTEPISIFAPDLYDFKKPLAKRSKPGFVSAYTSDMDGDAATVKSTFKEFKIIKN